MFCVPSKVVVGRYPGPGGDRRGPAYPQDEPGRGTHDGGIVPEPILSSARNLHPAWNPNQRVSPGMRSQFSESGFIGRFVVGSPRLLRGTGQAFLAVKK